MIRRRAFPVAYISLLAALVCGIAAAADQPVGASTRYALAAPIESAPARRFTLTTSTVIKRQDAPAPIPRYRLVSADAVRTRAAKSGGDPCALDDGIFGNGFEQ